MEKRRNGMMEFWSVGEMSDRNPKITCPQ